MQQIANDCGVGGDYATLVGQMKPAFDSMSTTRSNVAFYGKIDGVKSGAVIVSLSPTESKRERGVAFGIYVDRLSEFFNLEKPRVIDVLPDCDKIEETGDWAGDIHRGFAKSSASLEPLITLMKQAK